MTVEMINIFGNRPLIQHFSGIELSYNNSQ